jgi:hypothetical protein
MKVTVIRYEKLINLGNFSNHKIGVEVALDEGDTPSEALKRAKAFFEKSLEPDPDPYQAESARKIVDHPDDYAPKRVREAQEILDQITRSDIPF